MHTKLFAAITLLLFTSSATAQFSFGPRAGFNLSKLSFSDDDFTISFKPGFYIGGFAHYPLAKKMSLQGEVLYSSEGTKEKRISTNVSGNITKSYLQIPVLFRYRFYGNFFAEAGPQLGFLLSSKEKWGSSNKNDIKKYYKSSDFRLPVGAGYNFKGNLDKLGVNIRYSFSLSHINAVTVGGGNLKNQVISIGAQYRL